MMLIENKFSGLRVILPSPYQHERIYIHIDCIWLIESKKVKKKKNRIVDHIYIARMSYGFHKGVKPPVARLFVQPLAQAD